MSSLRSNIICLIWISLSTGISEESLILLLLTSNFSIFLFLLLEQVELMLNVIKLCRKCTDCNLGRLKSKSQETSCKKLLDNLRIVMEGGKDSGLMLRRWLPSRSSCVRWNRVVRACGFSCVIWLLLKDKLVNVSSKWCHLTSTPTCAMLLLKQICFINKIT